MLSAMDVTQHYLGCLSQASYTVSSQGDAAVIDPRRDVEEYLSFAREKGLRIRYVIETHLHADFVSGHAELAERSGAEVVFCWRAEVGFPHRAVKDGDELPLGGARLRVLETPGHTPESLCLLAMVGGEPRYLFTGDTLFIGDVGRPDLVGGSGPGPDEMAGLLYDSLRDKILPLPGSVRVYPAHGAGSLCGRNMSKETSATLEDQKAGNWALQPQSRETFVRELVKDLPEVPRHFARDVALNRQGARALAAIGRPRHLALPEAHGLVAQGAILLDVRSPEAFGETHPAGAIHIALGGQFAAWAGCLLEPGRSVILVVEEEEEAAEAVMRLARVGLENVQGYTVPGDWTGDAAARLAPMSVDELRDHLGSLTVVDVRRLGEFKSGHVPGARNVPLDRLPDLLPTLEASRATAVICAGGYRSSVAGSLLQRAGFGDLRNVVGGTSAWVAAGGPTELG
jgi:glyoxylase-like metal-dependent hydrolase (beta-lactamase superfamily II)/rhodanese-related sulfurtransferase